MALRWRNSWILIAILFLALDSVRAATGDIVAAEILSDGWRVRLTVEGFTTGATVNHGYTNAAAGATQPVQLPNTTATSGYLTVTSQGYTGTTLGTKVRTILLGKPMRFPYDTRRIAGSYSSGTFVRHEVVTQTTSGITGIMVGDQSGGPFLHLTGVSATPSTTTNWTGGTSGAVFVPTDFGTLVTNTTVSGEYGGTLDQRLDGSSRLVLEIPLTDWVYQDDESGSGKSGTDPTITIPTGFIVNSGGGSQSSVAVSAGSITNNSAIAYRKVKFWWMWPSCQRFTSTVTPRAFAWAPHGSGGKPGIECVTFSATAGATVTGTTYYLQKDYSMPQTEFRYACVPTFIHSLETATMTQGTEGTLNAVAYPQIGDEVSLYDTSSNTLLPEQIYGTQNFLCDKDETYGVTYAVVSTTGSDPANSASIGDEAGKWLGSGSDPTGGAGTAYASIGRAAHAIYRYNNTNRSRGDMGAGIVYVQAGSYPAFGTSTSYAMGSTPKTHITVQPYPGVTRAEVNLNAKGGPTALTDRFRLYNLTFSSITNGTLQIGLNENAIWLDQIDLNVAGGGTIAPFASHVMLTHCKLTAMSGDLKYGTTTTYTNYPLIRGCEFAGMDDDVHVQSACVGNYQLTKYASGHRFSDRFPLYTGPDANSFIGFNNIRGWLASGASSAILYGNIGESETNGAGMIQNIFECTESPGGHPGIGEFASGDGASLANYPFNDCFVEGNLFIGQRMQFAYNSDEAVLKARYYWQVRNTVWETIGIKSDDFTGSTRNGKRQGDWPIFFGAGCYGNVNIDVESVAGASFKPYWIGIGGYDGSLASPVNTATWAQFTNRMAAVGSGSPSTGLGDYTLQKTSPLRNLQTNESFTIPFDMVGRRRRAVDAAGPYSQHKTVGRFTF